jgi:hypothetical protein
MNRVDAMMKFDDALFDCIKKGEGTAKRRRRRAKTSTRACVFLLPYSMDTSWISSFWKKIREDTGCYCRT